MYPPSAFGEKTGDQGDETKGASEMGPRKRGRKGVGWPRQMRDEHKHEFPWVTVNLVVLGLPAKSNATFLTHTETDPFRHTTRGSQTASPSNCRVMGSARTLLPDDG